MFTKARLKLTAWYLLIIMVISISFSVVIFRYLSSELDRVEKMQRRRLERQINGFFSPGFLPNQIPPEFYIVDPEVIEETKNRLILSLALINLLILGTSSAGGYFLAGRTLKPIAEMLSQQKQFVADASHELRTPLTALKTEIEVNLRDKKLNLTSAKQILNSNLEEINKLKGLTDYFLTLSKYQDGNIKLNMENFPISEAIASSIKKIAPHIKEKKIILEKDIYDFSLTANILSIIELVTILLDNAVKYTKEGKKVFIKCYSQKNHGLIKIIDEGKGIPKDDLPHIFDRFYRADLSRSENPEKGYGLGLAIAKSIVDLHHGHIEAESTLGKGSVFTVYLPLKHQI